MKRLFLLSAMTLQRFDLHPGSVKVTHDPRDFEMGLVLQPERYKIRMTLRDV